MQTDDPFLGHWQIRFPICWGYRLSLYWWRQSASIYRSVGFVYDYVTCQKTVHSLELTRVIEFSENCTCDSFHPWAVWKAFCGCTTGWELSSVGLLNLQTDQFQAVNRKCWLETGQWTAFHISSCCAEWQVTFHWGSSLAEYLNKLDIIYHPVVRGCLHVHTIQGPIPWAPCLTGGGERGSEDFCNISLPEDSVQESFTCQQQISQTSIEHTDSWCEVVHASVCLSVHLPVHFLWHQMWYCNLCCSCFDDIDPLTFHDGFRLVRRNGNAINPKTEQNCFIETGGNVLGTSTKSLVTSYSWVYVLYAILINGHHWPYDSASRSDNCLHCTGRTTVYQTFAPWYETRLISCHHCAISLKSVPTVFWMHFLWFIWSGNQERTYIVQTNWIKYKVL